MTVTAVVQKWKGHSNYEFDVISRRKAPEYLDWGYASGTTLFRVAPGTDMDALGKKLKDIEVDMKGNIRKYPVHITPITEYHYTHPKYNIFIRIEYVRLFCLISLLIVLGALSNYLIIYLIRIRMMQREWALRKVNGASERSLVALLMSEIVLLLLASVPVGFLLVEVSLPIFKRWSYITEENNLFFYKETLIYISIVIGTVGYIFRYHPSLFYLLPTDRGLVSIGGQYWFYILYNNDDETIASSAYICRHGSHQY